MILTSLVSLSFSNSLNFLLIKSIFSFVLSCTVSSFSSVAKEPLIAQRCSSLLIRSNIWSLLFAEYSVDEDRISSDVVLLVSP